MITKTAQAGGHYVTIEQGPQRVLFRTVADARLDGEGAKLIQAQVGFPADRHGFENFLCYRDEHGGWQLDWSCFVQPGPRL